MKKTTLIGITSSTVLLALVSSYIVSNNSLIVSFANTPKSPYSVTFDASNITDDTYCGNDSGTMYLSSKVNTTNDMLDLMLSYSIDGSSYHNQYGRILRYDVSGSWEGKYDLYFTLWKGIDNFTSVELIGSFTDIEDNVSSNITYTESSTDVTIDLDSEDNWTFQITDCVYTIFDLSSIVINYSC